MDQMRISGIEPSLWSFAKNQILELIKVLIGLDWLLNVTINDVSVIHVTAHRCVGGLKKTLDLRSGSHTIHIS